MNWIKIMNTQDDLAWKREFEHVEERQKQREGQDSKQARFAGGKTYQLPKTIKTTAEWEQANEK